MRRILLALFFAFVPAAVWTSAQTAQPASQQQQAPANLGDLETHLADLPRDREIITYCS
jgi:hypothetical protein